VQKIFESHLIEGNLSVGETVLLKVDEVYTQDATGTMAWLQFEAIGIDKVKVPLVVSYVDHNMLQSNSFNCDDHIFLQTAAKRFGAYFSKPGGGICHQVNLERFARPGWIGLGTDSHTPTNGGIGMIAIGIGGLEAATVMAGFPFEIKMPKVVLVKLKGKLKRPWVTAMDVILELLRRLSVKGGIGKILEYGGEGVKDLDVTERATITNMGAELGATTSIFPSDEITKQYLKAQGRLKHWIELKADEDAEYDEIIEIDLRSIEPLIAKPHSPDNVVPVREVSGTKVNQVCIGSCTNSSYKVMRTVASILKGKKIAEHLSLLINPGSRQVYEMIARDGSLADMISAGARMLESSCGPCIGMGGAPGSGETSVRSYNRNFKGRCAVKDAQVYLANPFVCSIIAIMGEIVDPRDINIQINEPVCNFFQEKFLINDSLLIPPLKDNSGVKIIKRHNIKDVPIKEPISDKICAEVLIKVGNNITTDDIMPAGAKILPLRSNIPAISEYVFHNIDPEFSKRAKSKGKGIIIAGENYGQGSSREHAALAPMYLGIKAVIAISFARIHRANLINFGILPLIFDDHRDFQKIDKGDLIEISAIFEALNSNQKFIITNITKGYDFKVHSDLSQKEIKLILAGGLLPYLTSSSH